MLVLDHSKLFTHHCITIVARPLALQKRTEEQVTVPPTEGTDRPTKLVYKMSSKPRGYGIIIFQYYWDLREALFLLPLFPTTQD